MIAPNSSRNIPKQIRSSLGNLNVNSLPLNLASIVKNLDLDDLPNRGDVVKKIALEFAKAGLIQKYKGGVFGGVVAEVGKSLMNSRNSDVTPWTQVNTVDPYNNKVNGFITRIHFSIGYHSGSKLKKLKSSPFHQSQTVMLEDTESDRIDHKHRQVLTSAIGFNEKAFDILGSATYLNVNDIRVLAEGNNKNNDNQIETSIKKSLNYQKEILKALELLYSKHKNVEVQDLLNDVVNSTNTDNFSNSTEEIKPQKDYPKVKFNRVHKNKKLLSTDNFLTITKVSTKLKIKNLLPDFQCNIKLHLCKIKNPFTSDKLNVTPDGIPSMIITDYPERVFSESCTEFSTGYDFKTTMKTHLNLNLVTSSNFNRHVQVVKTWCRTLTENSQFYFHLTEHLGDGICLEDLYRNCLNESSIEKKIPVGHFFVVEYFGDPRATITRKKDGDVFNGYSPVKINYRLEHSVSFIVNQNDLDKPVVLKKVRTGDSFVSEDLSKQFYPDRESKFHVPYEDIDILSTSKDNHYTLNLSNDLENDTLVSKFVSSLNNLGVDDLKNFTEDDVDFLQSQGNLKESLQNTTPIDENDSDQPTNLRKNIKP